MRRALFRVAVMAFAALVSACGGTSRVGDELTATSLSQSRKAVALIKLGAADPMCSALQAGIGVRQGDHYKIVETARIQRSAKDTLVAELELGAGEYHVVSYTCNRPRGAIHLADSLGGGVFRKSYASFSLAPGEILNVGYLQLVPMASTQVAYTRVLAVRLAVTDWPLAELERFKRQRPGLYGQMKTRLMTVPRVDPPTMQQVQARCAELRRLQAEGKLQNLPPMCNLPRGTPPARKPGKSPGKDKSIGA
ncbi:MAG: hypothetical protein WAN86_27405 [Hyphomicrobiaceae bacterium]